MDTELLYNIDPYMKEFEADILEVLPYENKFAAVLDRTVFYPEGGGQPSDTGSLDGIRVLQVLEKGGRILHIMEEIPLDTHVNGSIDWQRRFDHMQQHTGQHILSACFEELYQGHTDSFHMGRDIVSIEISIDSFSAEEAAKIENMANGIIYSNLPVTSSIVAEGDLSSLPLRKMPKVKENIRIVQVSNFDYSPCAGTHVGTTGEVGIIKIKSWEKCKGGMRFVFVCGYRALKDYGLQNFIIRTLCEKLSVKDSDITEAIEKMMDNLRNTEKQLASAVQELIKGEADGILRDCPVTNGIRLITRILDGRNINDVKLLGQYLTQSPGTIALLAGRNENAQVVFTRSDDIELDMNALFKTAIPMINGRGGGNSKTAQGGGSIVGLEAFMEAASGSITL